MLSIQDLALLCTPTHGRWTLYNSFFVDYMYPYNNLFLYKTLWFSRSIHLSSVFGATLWTYICTLEIVSRRINIGTGTALVDGTLDHGYLHKGIHWKARMHGYTTQMVILRRFRWHTDIYTKLNPWFGSNAKIWDICWHFSFLRGHLCMLCQALKIIWDFFLSICPVRYRN